MTHQFLETGKIVNTHGLRGEVIIQPWADSPEFLCNFKTLYIDNVPRKVLNAYVHKSNVIVLFEGISTIDDAIRLKNKVVSIARSDANLTGGTYFVSDLVGTTAIDESTGLELGRISEIMTLPQNNVYVISGPREILVPAVPEFIKDVDLIEGRVLVHLIEGM